MAEKLVISEGEIDLLELVRHFWLKRWLIARVTGVFLAIGLLVAYTSPVEYETSCTLITEVMGSESNLGGSIGGLASLAGIDIGGVSGSGSTISPGLYRSIAQSTPFLLELMDIQYYSKNLERKISIKE